MKKLHFTYDMNINYSEDVSKCNFTIKCVPINSVRQTINNLSIRLFPDSAYNTGRDGLNNMQIYGFVDTIHTRFDLHVEGDAITGLSDYEELEDNNLSMIFLHPHGLNKPGPNINTFYKSINCPNYKSALERAIFIMNALHSSFSYKPLITDIKTGAEEAFSLGAGVCQDYAHVFISLLHLEGIPARYVTGLLIGEGASHAWVEILNEGKWYGLDPTNNTRVYDDHIKIGVGRDAGDCTINRGIMRGGGLHTQTVKVSVKEK